MLRVFTGLIVLLSAASATDWPTITMQGVIGLLVMRSGVRAIERKTAKLTPHDDESRKAQ